MEEEEGGGGVPKEGKETRGRGSRGSSREFWLGERASGH